MIDPLQPYLTSCPVGCDAALAPTAITLPEGNLRRCAECGQLLSRVSESVYRQSMQQFDQHEFNLPPPRERHRRFKIARRRLEMISTLLGKVPSDIRVLDVGCSRGNFLAAGTRLGFQMEGVEPAAAVAAAAQAAGLKVHAGLLEDIGFPLATFDVVTLFEVSTGNTASWTAAAMQARWDYFHIARDGGHISFYNPRSIALLAARCDFEVARIETTRVKFYEKSDVPRWRYVAAKLAAETLNLPARLANRGHDMLVYLRVRD